MALSTVAPVTATVTSLLALTTPFVQPPSCNNVFETTTVVKTSSWDNSIYTLTYHVSVPSIPQFTACQPSGWADRVPEKRFSFSPAVCPSQWTAWIVTGNAAKTSAVCCAAGYRVDSGPGVPLPNIPAKENACYKFPTSSQLPTSVHNPWFITWAESDRATLSPKPPVLSCVSKTLVSWAPGMPEATCEPDQHDIESRKWQPVTSFLMIGLPIIFGCLLLCCGACCFVRIRRRRRNRREQNAATGTEPYSNGKTLPTK